MPARIRLQRYGKKGKPFYHIVIADGRAPRDGKYIENIGTYNPLTTPATIDLNIDKAIQWLKNGATPSDTAKAILAYKGVLYKYHLQKGVAKGALTPEQAEAKFNAWLTEKEEKIAIKIKSKELAKKESKKKAINQEKEVNEAREKQQMAKMAKLAQKEAALAQHEEAVAEIATDEAPVVDEVVVTEEVAVVEEAVVEAIKEEVVEVVATQEPIVAEQTETENTEEVKDNTESSEEANKEN